MSNDMVTLTASNGEVVRVGTGASGLDTGWAVIANPYYRHPPGDDLHDPNWKAKDGETVMGVPKGSPGAMPVADAYQALHAEMDTERAEWDQMIVGGGDEEMVEWRCHPPA